MTPAGRFLVSMSIASALLVSACGGSGRDESDGALTVFAASSLTAAFEEIGVAFTDANPGTEVRLNVAASSELAAQVLEGAPADVVAFADDVTMARLTDEGLTSGSPVVFATNSMAIAVAAGNPLGITSLADLTKPDLLVVRCDDAAPCGRYAMQVLDAAGVTLTPRSLEENARAAVAKVGSGEADAAIVFTTDALAAGSTVERVDIPDEVNVLAVYPIAATRSAGADAIAFVEFVTSAAGRRILAAHGFGAP